MRVWRGRRQSRRAADTSYLSSKVLLGQLASAGANITAAEAFAAAAAADFSDGNLGAVTKLECQFSVDF